MSPPLQAGELLESIDAHDAQITSMGEWVMLVERGVGPPHRFGSLVCRGASAPVLLSQSQLVRLILHDSNPLATPAKPQLRAAWCPRKVKSPGSPAPHAVLATSSLDKRVRLWRWP